LGNLVEDWRFANDALPAINRKIQRLRNM